MFSTWSFQIVFETLRKEWNIVLRRCSSTTRHAGYTKSSIAKSLWEHKNRSEVAQGNGKDDLVRSRVSCDRPATSISTGD
jgi:hypothetical protein